VSDADNPVCEGFDAQGRWLRDGRQDCLPHAHLHPLIALPIVTKFLA
jgi:hypothetical protein